MDWTSHAFIPALLSYETSQHTSDSLISIFQDELVKEIPP